MLMVRWDGQELERDGNKPSSAETERRTTQRLVLEKMAGPCPSGTPGHVKPRGFYFKNNRRATGGGTGGVIVVGDDDIF